MPVLDYGDLRKTLLHLNSLCPCSLSGSGICHCGVHTVNSSHWNVGVKVWLVIRLVLLGKSEGNAESEVRPAGILWEESYSWNTEFILVFLLISIVSIWETVSPMLPTSVFPLKNTSSVTVILVGNGRIRLKTIQTWKWLGNLQRKLKQPLYGESDFSESLTSVFQENSVDWKI